MEVDASFIVNEDMQDRSNVYLEAEDDHEEEEIEEEDGTANDGIINHHLDFPVAEEMDLETLRDPFANTDSDDDDGEEGEGGVARAPIETNKFVSLWRELIKPEPFDLYCHACSWAVKSYDGKPGYVATYLLQRLLPPILEPDDDDSDNPSFQSPDGSAMSTNHKASTRNHHRTRSKIRRNRSSSSSTGNINKNNNQRLVTRLLQKDEAKSYKGNEEGLVEVALLHKWENTSRFHEMLSFESIIKAYTYTLTRTNWYAGMNQMAMFLKQNGMHQELETGRIGQQLQPQQHQQQQQQHQQQQQQHQQQQHQQQQQQHGDESCNDQMQQEEKGGEEIERELFVMIRQRKLKTSTSMAQFDLVLQIINHLSEVSLQEESDQCLMYDIHTLRHADPMNESRIEEVLEIGIWNTIDDYFDGHLSKEYVKQSSALDVCFEEMNDESITYWKLLAPHGLFVPNPDVSFMDEVTETAA